MHLATSRTLGQFLLAKQQAYLGRDLLDEQPDVSFRQDRKILTLLRHPRT
jgi:hypothetical protein